MKDIKFILDILTHILILLTVLSILFWKLVFKKEKNDLSQKLDSGINLFFKNVKNNLNPEQIYFIKSEVNKNRKSLEILETVYSKPDPIVEYSNKKLLNLNLFMIGLIITIIITTIFILHFVCKYNVDYLSLLKHNIFSFLFLGVIEVFFFKFILSKYVSVKPGYVYQNLQKSFNK